MVSSFIFLALRVFRWSGPCTIGSAFLIVRYPETATGPRVGDDRPGGAVPRESYDKPGDRPLSVLPEG
jgi:hypothetical protein